MNTAYMIAKPHSRVEASGSTIDCLRRGELRLRLPSGIGGTGMSTAAQARAGRRSRAQMTQSGRR